MTDQYHWAVLFSILRTEYKLQQAAHQNEQLLRGLGETDTAPSQLQQQNDYIADLDSQIQKTAGRVETLQSKARVELKEHEKYRDSTFRPFAHKASGKKEKFAEKAAKEEKDYFDATQELKSAEDELAYTKQLRGEAESRKEELDALYKSIFASHTPEFPDGERKEEACTSALANVQQINQHLERERHILFLVGQTSLKLSAARTFLEHAYGMSQFDKFGGGAMASMQKLNELERAESAMAQVRMLQDQLRQVAPEIPALSHLNMASGSIFSDIIFDNVFIDVRMHERIKASIAQVDRAGQTCGHVIRHREPLEHNLQTKARHDLQKARGETFQRVLRGAAAPQVRSIPVSRLLPPPPEYAPPDGPPPGYSS